MTISVFDLNLRHLRAVSAIAEAGRIGVAAEQVSLSQPALTQGLARLEEQLATRLFRRTSQGVLPTPAGTLLAERTREAMAHLARAMHGSGRGRFAAPERMLTMAQLRAFIALADAGSFALAAAATSIAPPSLHRAARDVERLAAGQLIERRGRGIVLSDRGRRVARGIRLAITALEAGLGEVVALSGGEAARLVIGAMPLARARLLPAALADLARPYPNARIVVTEGAYRELAELLRDGKIDLMVGALRDEAPDLVQQPLCADRLAVIARADHPLVAGGMADRDGLARYPWIVGLPGAPLRALWARMFEGAPALPPAPIDCGSVMTIRGILLASDFLTLLSPDQVWVELDGGLLRIVDCVVPPATRTIGLCHRADWRPTAIQRDLIARLHAVAADLAKTNGGGVDPIG